MTVTTTEHDRRAIEQREAEAVTATTSARQGDLILRRVGDCPAGLGYHATPEAGLVVAAGRHGEHRLIGGRVAGQPPVDGWSRLAIDDGEAIVVHTDVPSGRHCPVRLAVGVWEWRKQQELTADAVVVEVMD